MYQGLQPFYVFVVGRVGGTRCKKHIHAPEVSDGIDRIMAKQKP